MLMGLVLVEQRVLVLVGAVLLMAVLALLE
jgi:hypothetical protein